MASQYIGLVVGTRSKRVYGVINPEEDGELDNPRHLLIQIEPKLREPVTMAKVDRDGYESCMTPDEVHVLVNAWYVTSSFVHEGIERLDDM